MSRIVLFSAALYIMAVVIGVAPVRFGTSGTDLAWAAKAKAGDDGAYDDGSGATNKPKDKARNPAHKPGTAKQAKKPAGTNKQSAHKQGAGTKQSAQKQTGMNKQSAQKQGTGTKQSAKTQYGDKLGQKQAATKKMKPGSDDAADDAPRTAAQKAKARENAQAKAEQKAAKQQQKEEQRQAKADAKAAKQAAKAQRQAAPKGQDYDDSEQD